MPRSIPSFRTTFRWATSPPTCSGIGDAPGTMTFSARGPMVAAAVEDAARLLALAGCTVETFTASGVALAAGAPILAAHGPAGALHRGWKMGQLLIETASGIATATRAIVEAARAVNPMPRSPAPARWFPAPRRCR